MRVFTLFTSSFFGLIAFTSLAFAVAVDKDDLSDPDKEQRARNLMQEIRCLVCQSQSIEFSNSELAGDLRRLVRERISAGDTDEEVIDYLVDRYGDWVRLKPPLNPNTYLLWFAPLVIALFGGLGVAVYFRNQGADLGESPPTGKEPEN